MNPRAVGLVMVIGLCGCGTPPPGAPTDLGDGFRREDHPAFTAQEQVVASTTRRYLEERTHRRIDAYYRVRHTTGGYDVLVFEVSRYEKNQPRFRVGGDWGVTVGDDGTVKQCWKGY